MKESIKIAVRELVEFVHKSGDLSMQFTGAQRPVDAIRAHQQIQRSRPVGYEAEVSLTHLYETERFILQIGGRIDGVYTSKDQSPIQGLIVIDEIKTTTRNLEHFDYQTNNVHWAQAKCYAYIFSVLNGLKEIGIQLTYCQLDSGDTREYRHTFTLRDLTQFFVDTVTPYLKWAEAIIDWRRIRNNSIVALEFPFTSYRRGQRQMAVAVYRAIATDGQLIVQAATGIGKTMAAIFPAVKAIAEKHISKIFYLTARTTGRHAAEKAIEELRGRGLSFKSLTLTAKDKICFQPDKSCNGDECEYASGYYDRLREALPRAYKQDAFTREVIESLARSYRLCPFELSLTLSLYADCVICDYNYAFDPRVYLRRFFDEGNNDYTFLIDEGHNLVDRSREMFSAEICKQTFLDVRRPLRKSLPRIFRSMGKVNTWMLKARKSFDSNENNGEAYAEKESPDGLYPHLKRFLLLTREWLELNQNTDFRDDLLNLYFSAIAFMRIADAFDQHYVTCYEKMGKDFKVKLFCIDPSGQLREALKRCQSAVFFSATMSPVEYFKNILGCRQSATHLILPSPFPVENLKVIICNRISTLYRQRNQTTEVVSSAIASLVTQKKGNYLLFFPSYEYMRQIYDVFRLDNFHLETIVQTPDMPEAERDRFLSRFSHENLDTLVGFAVMGGIFGEGIDLVGERLSGAAIIGVGLPGISLENDLIREYFSETLNAGFEFAYMYPGINRVLQAAGRVIRTEKDRGVVMLIDQRFGTHRYRSLLPREWKPLYSHNGQRLEEQLLQFWYPPAGGTNSKDKR